MYFWMKKLFFLTLILFCLGCNEKKITFPHGYVWEKTLPNQSELIDPAGNIILSGYLSLWSQYPFVYGNGNKNNDEFVLNLKTGEIIYIAPIERSAKLRESSERRDYEHEKTMDRQGKARDSA